MLGTPKGMGVNLAPPLQAKFSLLDAIPFKGLEASKYLTSSFALWTAASTMAPLPY
jgi:hypothetical protein